MEAFWNFCLEMTNRGSTVSTLGEEITLESIAETLLGITPGDSSHDDDADETPLPLLEWNPPLPAPPAALLPLLPFAFELGTE